MAPRHRRTLAGQRSSRRRTCELTPGWLVLGGIPPTIFSPGCSKAHVLATEELDFLKEAVDKVPDAGAEGAEGGSAPKRKRVGLARSVWVELGPNRLLPQGPAQAAGDKAKRKRAGRRRELDDVSDDDDEGEPSSARARQAPAGAALPPEAPGLPPLPPMPPKAQGPPNVAEQLGMPLPQGGPTAAIGEEDEYD